MFDCVIYVSAVILNQVNFKPVNSVVDAVMLTSAKGPVFCTSATLLVGKNLFTDINVI